VMRTANFSCRSIFLARRVSTARAISSRVECYGYCRGRKLWWLEQSFGRRRLIRQAFYDGHDPIV
jgi:hypothetical protein